MSAKAGTQLSAAVSKVGMKASINVTPYIDILLVLLIVFMVIQPAAQYDLKARVPQEPKKGIESTFPSIVLSIDREVNLQINGGPVAWRDLGSRLFELLSRRSDRRIFVSADGELSFGAVVRAIDVAKGAGAGDIGLLQEWEPHRRSTVSPIGR
jgi:biopolymer transport protein TolR